MNALFPSASAGLLERTAPEQLALAGGRRLQLRAVRAADSPALQAFFTALSVDSRHQRFHAGVSQIGPGLLRRMVEVDPQRHVALVAETPGAAELVADARYVHGADGTAEFAIAVADAWQGLGLARALMARLGRLARAQGLRQLYGDVLPGNRRMLAVMRGLGAELHPHPEDDELQRLVFELGRSLGAD
ncbi:GNAT family N-acetyltransferase [Inhella proteolytica]|uniref:GNAT family N-acetyltransferase n=1 Tax=Inhella proteolytica TaxID=2795029 RepID=A0A931NDA6_9BURK|nr:GNAT family N-acetyltransferase [Inhella proteolytica]MBH9576467.1 GNAT family N-acetyltransferase [Inhella proteolytica]